MQIQHMDPAQQWDQDQAIPLGQGRALAVPGGAVEPAAKRGFSMSSRSAFPHHPLPAAAQILHESCPASPSSSGSATAELHFPPSCASRGFFSMREQPTTSQMACHPPSPLKEH